MASKSASRKIRSIKDLNESSAIGIVPHISFSVNRNSQKFYNGGVTALDVRPEVSIPFSSANWKYQETKPHLIFEQDQAETKQRPKCKNKYSVVLHEFCSRSTSVNRGTAKPVSTERSYEVEDELIQPSHNDQITRMLVEPNIKVINNRYKIPVPMKKDVIKVLPNNFNYALERTALLRCQTLKNSRIKRTLIENYDEMISAGWLAPVDNALKKNSCWYLPFFLTKQKEPKVVFNNAASSLDLH